MNFGEKLDTSSKPREMVQLDSVLGNEALIEGEYFVNQAQYISEIPNLDFSDNSKVFILIPAFCELENAEKLFSSWNSQILPEETSLEIIILINQKTDDLEDTTENQQTFEMLQNLYERNKKSNIRFHFIDKFSQAQRLNESINIGDIRNILSATVIKSAIINRQNGILLSTDADTFPTEQCAQELQRKFLEDCSVYGSVDKKIQFDESIPKEDQEKIKQLFLLSDIHTILLEYFSSGRLTLPESMGAGGAGFFCSIDQFIKVGGYSSMDFGEDTDLLNKLYAKQPNDFKPILTPELTNTIRFSNRLDGDGALLSELKQEGYPANHSIDITRAHAQIRQWFSNSLINQNSFEKAVANFRLEELLDFLSSEERQKIKSIVSGKIEGEDDNEKIENLFRNILKKLYELRKEKIELAIESYAKFIKNNLSENTEFLAIFSENQKDFSEASDEDTIRAFIVFVEKINSK